MNSKFPAILSALLVQSAVLVSPVHATAISDSSVILNLDWDSMSDVVVWSEGDFKFNGADANLEGVTASNYQTEDGWSGDPALSYSAQVTADAMGNASTGATSASASAHARADGIGAISDTDEDVSASGTSHRGKVFSPIADGEVTFSFGYAMSQLFSKDFPAEGYSGWSIAELILRLGSEEIGYDDFILNNAGTSETGNLTFTVDLLASNSYYLEGHVYTSATARAPKQEATIPEPGTLALMGLGMAGLGFCRRNRAAA